jgi:hypothetical protein
MKRLWTGLLVVAIAAIAVAALVDVFVGFGRDETRRDETPADARPLPACGRNQLALVLEHLGGSTGVALRHVQGPPCHRSRVALSAVVVNGRGLRSQLPLDHARFLEGDFTPGFEQVVGLTFCGSAPPFTVEARAGPYSVRGHGRFGPDCESIQYERTVDFDPPRGTRRFKISPLDTRTHEVSFAIDLPQRAEVRVTVRTRGHDLVVLDRAGREGCRKIGSRESCLVRFALLGEKFFAPWSVALRKTSVGRAHISLAIAFVAVDA